MKDEKRFKHESYAIINASRVTTSGMKLFGSDIKNHSFIKLTISSAVLSRHLNKDWYHPEGGITEVYLTAIQWAEMLTNMNTQGVPCTLHYSEKKGVVEYKEPESSIEFSFNNAQEKIIENEASEYLHELREMIDKSKLGKKAKEEMDHLIGIIDGRQKDAAKFYLDSFKRSAMKIVSESKAEIEANRLYVIDQLGQTKLNEIKEAGGNVFDSIESPK